MNGKAQFVAILLAALALGSVTHSESASLKVSPGRFTIRDIEPGREYDVHRETGARLTVYNDGDKARTWTLSLHRPSERGRWEKGYSEIPDPSWCWFAEDEITVPPHGRAHAHLHLKIPDEERFYNQHWIVTATVGGRAGGGPIALAVDVRLLLETKSRTGLTASPHGAFGTEPSTVYIDNLVPGKTGRSRIAIHNNDDAPHEYTIDSLFADSETNRSTYLTGSFDALPERSWMTHPKSVAVGADESAILNVEIRIPEDGKNYGMKWEEILLIRPDEGIPRFVRIQMETEAEE
jgi:hypothetical protein